VGLGALGGMRANGSGDAYNKAFDIENKMYESRVQAGELIPDQHKRSRPMKSGESEDPLTEEN
jgi:hypothetical protein